MTMTGHLGGDAFRVAFDHAPIGVALVGLDGRFLRVNRTLADLLGRSPAELVDLRFADVTHPGDVGIETDHLRALVAGERDRCTLSKRYVRPDGAVVWGDVHVSVVRDDESTPLHFVAQIENVTERHDAERRMERIHRLYTVLAAGNQAIMRATSEDELLAAACRISVEIGGFHMAWAGRPVHSVVRPIVSCGDDGGYLQTVVIHLDDPQESQSPLAVTLREAVHVVVNDIGRSSRMRPWRDVAQAHEFRSAATFPLQRDGETVAGMAVYATEVDFFDDDSVRLLDDLAVDISFGLSNLAAVARHREAEAALRDSERRLTDFLDNLNAVAYMKDLDGRLVLVNRRYEEVIGVRREEVIGRRENEVIPGRGADVDASLAGDRLVVDEARMVEAEESVTLATGDTRTFLSTKFPVRDARGVPYAVGGISTDITERKAADRALQLRALQQAAVARLSGDGLRAVSLERLLDEAVELVAEVLDVPYTKILELLPSGGELLLRAGTGWRDGLVGRASITADESSQAGYTLHCGHPVVVSDLRTERRFIARPLLWDHHIVSGMTVVIGGVTGVFGVFGVHSDERRSFSSDDVNFLSAMANVIAAAIDRAHAERALAQANADLRARAFELEASNNELAEFAYVASHDLSEPLRTIAGFSSLLSERYHARLDADADEFLTFITGGVARMQQLIDDLLTYSRVDTHARPPAPTDFGAVAADVLRMLGAAIAESGAEIEVDPLPVVTGDAGQLAQVLQNLLSNAILFVAPGVTPRVRVAAEREPDGWRFVVADNGIGIDERHRERIFRMFQRLHARDVYPGTGIGLAVCKKILARHGGRIWVEDNPGGGSRFSFTVPDPTEVR